MVKLLNGEIFSKGTWHSSIHTTGAGHQKPDPRWAGHLEPLHLNWKVSRACTSWHYLNRSENSAETIKIQGRFCSSPARLLIGIWVRSSCTDHLISNQNGFMIHWRAKDHAANKLNLVTNKSRNSIKPTIIFNLLLDGGQWRDDHRGHALKMHIMDGSKISMINIMISARAEDRR